jgi:hypothetical protein
VIAIAGPNLPHELLDAADCHGGPLPFDPDRLVSKAAAWLESKFFPWAPAVLESWAEGAYDAFDAVLFSRADDTSQRLYYYVCELQRRGLLAGPEPLILDITKIQRASSLQHLTVKLRQLADRLGVGNQALEEAIRRGNLARREMPTHAKGPACLLAGSPPPDTRLHRVISEAGFQPVGQTLEQLWMDPGEEIAEGTGDPIAAIATQLHGQPEGSRSFVSSSRLLQQHIEQCRARAVIIWRIEEDEAMTWHQPAEVRMLEASSVPHLVLSRMDWLARDDAARRIAEFLQGVDA